MAGSMLLRPTPDVMRVVFLYVGQGESTLVLAPDGAGGHNSLLIDCNNAPALRGIDLPRLLQDLPTKDGDRPRLDVFANTHPHSDHLCGVAKIEEAVSLKGVWHSGHEPSKAHEGPYEELQAVIGRVEGRGGEIVELLGSRSPRAFGAALIHTVSPARHVRDDIADETGEARDRRIHEHCAVFRVRYSTMKGVLITGDSDRTAWREHITNYHGAEEDNRIAASVLSASHHGSRSFFKDTEDDADVYTDHLTRINPRYVIVSCPDQKDSPHGHPHDDAVRLYAKHVGEENVLHMGSRRWSYVVDVPLSGKFTIYEDRGELADCYGLEPEAREGGGGRGGGRAPALVIPHVEHSRPMGGV